MSGTSVDGLDIAVCQLIGTGRNTDITITHFETVNYTDVYRDAVAAIFSKRNVDLEAVCLTNAWIGVQHGTMILSCLKKWGIAISDIDLIASHGQTIYHAPKSLHQQEQFGNATLQIGDGDHLAITTGIITLSDFRQKHIAAGGEGAPLAVYGDYLIFGKKEENRVMLNIGGIANFTYLPGTMQLNEVFSTDVGPGNTLMDAFAKKYFNSPFDANAAIAERGKCNSDLLNALQAHPFFDAAFPKTTGPELFNLNYLEQALNISNTSTIAKEDIMRTLNQFTANTIAVAIHKSFSNTHNLKIYSSGGGMHNPLLMQNLQAQLPDALFLTTADLKINPDAKEAVLFAILANEAVAGDIDNFNTTRTDIPAVSMGKISFPS
jgi:anhydro-N-acetylmuramic acid kinase